MSETQWLLILVAMAYLLGSLSSAILFARLFKLPDPRLHGSGNPGATNMLRVAGRKVAGLTLLGDGLKGVPPVLLALWVELADWGLALVALSALLGHIYPLFFGFKGGKGVATALGVTLAAWWPVGLFIAGLWLLMAVLVRISSISALTAFLGAPFFAFLYFSSPVPAITLSGFFVLLVWRHRKNISNLIKATEDKIKT